MIEDLKSYQHLGDGEEIKEINMIILYIVTPLFTHA